MDEAKQEIHNQASVFGQVGTNEGTIIQNFSQNTGSIKPPLPENIWTVPYPHNPFFTGREYYLDQLHNNLLAQKTAALTQPQAINGLGGIGKTQIAAEYAHRHRENYSYIFWMNAATIETLFKDFTILAKLLGLPLSSEMDQEITITFVKNWLGTHDRWLLVMDNADNLELARDFLPTGNTGHILLTTREQVVSSFANIEVQKMDIVESTLMLLRRANRLSSTTDEEKKKAEAIAKEMDGLPLALDQAGAYIEEIGCTVAEYFERYKQQHITYLQRRGRNRSYHPESVATTWSLSFEQVEQRNLLAANLLRCCAFLAPDNIPEEFFTEGTNELSLLLQPIANDSSLLDEAIGELRRFSLVRCNQNDHTFSIHRLVQAILKTNINAATQQIWAKRAVHMVNHVFPRNIDFTTWKRCQRYISHTQSCANSIQQYQLAFPEAANLLNKAACYLDDFAFYPEAESLLKQALPISEQVFGSQHPNTAAILNNLAVLYNSQSKYEQAEQLYQRALHIYEQVLGPQHPDTAASLNNLAVFYKDQGKDEQAEQLFQRALRIREQVLGPQHSDTATSLNNLALLYKSQGKYKQAKPLYQRALRIREQVLGPQHPNTATSLNDLALLCESQGKYKQAESLLKQALHIYEQVLGPQHPDTKIVRENYTLLHESMKQKKESS